MSDSSYPEADEAQRGHYNDGYNPRATQPVAVNSYDQRQPQYVQYDFRHSVRHEHDRYITNQHRHPADPQPSSSIAAPLQDPYQQLPQLVSPLQGTHSAKPVNSDIGELYNRYEEQQTHTPSSRTLSQFERASSSHDSRSESDIWYGRIQRVPHRYKTIRIVPLFRGNFVFDSPVPSKLLERCALRHEGEFTHMRYSAATCDPNDFKGAGFTLRQARYDPPRRTELFIVMTMYNESDELFCQSMQGIIKNVAHLCKRDRNKTWGKDGWKKVVVCIVSDGRQMVNSRTLSVLAAMGVYQEGIAKNVVNRRAVTAHIYEYTTQVSISVSPSFKIYGAESGVFPVQLIFCLKEKNQKKINSHRWFFNAFGPVLQPNICVLLDVGTEPDPSSIYHLWKVFHDNRNVGGACGEIVAYKGRYGEYLFNPLVAAQNFEYKMTNILDKPLESVFGYITVLPGAFSAYRYTALQNNGGEGPLQKYFQGEEMRGGGSIFTANMYLAEDRILCWELVSKRGENWILHYVKSARAVTDVPDNVPELISQRRRWLNGSFFAAVHSIVHFHYIYRSSHSFLRKFWIHIEMFYQLFNLIFSWFALANYYIAFIILTDAVEDYIPRLHYVNIVSNYFYLGLLILCFLISLGSRPQGAKWTYTLAFIGFGLIMIYMTVSAFLLAYKGVESVAQGRPIHIEDFLVNSIFRNVVLALVATFGLYIISSLLSFEPWHMITSFLPYLLMAPSYITVLNVYAFANVHNVSWGTKGDNKDSTDLGVVSVGKYSNTVEVPMPVEEKDINAVYDAAIRLLSKPAPKGKQNADPTTKQQDFYKSFRTNVLLVWTLSNALLAACVVSSVPTPGSGEVSMFVNAYMYFILFSITGLAFVRFLGSTTYLIVRLFAGE